MKVRIVCYSCDTDLYEVTKFLRTITGTLLTADNLTPLNRKKQPKNGQKFICNKCGSINIYARKTNGEILKFGIEKV